MATRNVTFDDQRCQLVDADLIPKIAERLGNLCGAARYDWVSANPADVGLHGVPIKQWREAYFEGCKDMAQNVTAALPEGEQERVKEIARAAFDKAFKEAETGSKTEDAELAK